MNILGIDFSAMFRRNWEASGGKELSEAYKRTLQTVASIREGFDRVAILCDSGTSFRKMLLASYKADRERPPAPYYEQMGRTCERLHADGCSVFLSPAVGVVPGATYYAEADDLCAALASWCVMNSHALTIYGGDKDLIQLVDDEWKVSVWRPDYEGRWDRGRVIAKYGVEPLRINDWLALGGDKVDGFKMFPGWEEDGKKRPGIGPDIAAKLLARFGTIYGVIDAIEGKDAEGLPVMRDGHVKEVLRRGQPTPLAAATLGMQLATLRRDLSVDFGVLESEPVYASLTEDAPDSTSDPPSNPNPRAASTALARPVDATGIERYALQPRSANAMMQMAEWLFDSRLYGQYPTATAVFAVMLEANERGVPVGLALRNGYIVKGKPAWSAQFIGALVLASGKAKKFRIIESTADRAVLEYQRTDDVEPRLFEFTIEEARTAGWMKSGEKGDNKWITNPRTMLRWAAIREAARAFFFDVVAGMHTPDEIRGHATDEDFAEEAVA